MSDTNNKTTVNANASVENKQAPAESKPADAKPAESAPAESKTSEPADSKNSESEPKAAAPAESKTSQPADSKNSESESKAAAPAESKDPKNSEADSKPSGTVVNTSGDAVAQTKSMTEEQYKKLHLQEMSSKLGTATQGTVDSKVYNPNTKHRVFQSHQNL